MKIAVFNCPAGITAEGMVAAFRDAGLPEASLRRKRRPKGSSLHLGRALMGLRYFRIKKCFVRNLAIGRKGNPRILKLLRGFTLDRVPVDKEIVTAEGAAFLAAVCEKESSIPSMRLETVGFGPDHLQVSIGEITAPYRRERILLLETNIDDMSPQGFELLYERLFKAGAVDVWVETILMKKMRPAFKLSVLLDHASQEKISEVIFKETPTLGVRFLELDRFSLPRKSVRIKTRFGPVRIKIGRLDSKRTIVSPEYEDLKRISQRTRLPFRQIYQSIKRESEQRERAR